MADYEFRYQLLQAPSSRDDGSGVVVHDIQAVYRVEGSTDAYAPVPGHHLDIPVPAAELLAIIAGTKVAANYIAALVVHRGDQITSMVSDWSDAVLQAFMDANDASAEATAAARTFIEVTAHLTYPVTFAA